MPRPRFARLAPDKRDNILQVARREFSERGFAEASFNQIMLQCGLSKGAFYYYFDDKLDLYVAVVEEAVRRISEGIGDFPEFSDAEGYWAAATTYYTSELRFMAQNPDVVAVVKTLANERELLGATGPLAKIFQEEQKWIEDNVSNAQKVGAIRRDLPQSLLVALTVGLSQLFDEWILETWTANAADHAEETAALLIELARRLLAPAGAAPAPTGGRKAASAKRGGR